MINEPAVDKLVEILGTKDHPASRYELCVVVAKRARQVIDQAQNQGIKELPDKMKEIAFACREIESGKLALTRD